MALLLTVLSAFNNTYAFAESAGTEEESSNIVSYTDRLIVRPILMFPTLELRIFSKNDPEKEDDSSGISYNPQSRLSAGAGLSWKGWGFTISESVIPLNARDGSQEGKTDALDLQFFSYFRKLQLDLYYQHYSGYYYQSSNDNNDDADFRSDLSLTNAGVNLLYVFSDRYSLRSSFNQTERQIDSSGSWLAMASYNYLKISSAYSLIPPDQEEMFGTDSGYKGGRYTGFSLLSGYSYTFIFFDRWYTTLALLVGGGWMYQDYTVAAGNVKAHSLSSKYNGRLAFGYSGEKYFAGILSIIDIHSTEPFLGLYRRKSEIVTVTRMTVYGEAFAGIRF